MITKGDAESGAVFSVCDKYRYRLWRVWDASKPKLCFVMLNPSTATHEVLDPTVSRCKKRAETLGYGGLEVVNLFALRSTDPKALYDETEDPIGQFNNSAIYGGANESAMVICAWGTHGNLRKRGWHVTNMLVNSFSDKACYLKLNADGSPSHPLYLPYSLQPVLWKRS
jgi:hypothetical protein